MTEQMEVISFEKMDNATDIYQAEDGTLFEYCFVKKKIRVSRGDDDFIVHLPQGETIDTIALCGNALYFCTLHASCKKIYKIAVAEQECTGREVRRVEWDETIGSNGLCTRPTYDGYNRHIYHLGHSPVTGGVILDQYVKNEYRKERIHRGKVLFIEKADKLATKLQVLGQNALCLQVRLDGKWNSWAAEASPYIYIANGGLLYTVNVETLDVLPVLGLNVDGKRVGQMEIVSVLNGIVTATARVGMDFQKVKITALFPEGFFDKREEEAHQQQDQEFLSRSKNLFPELPQAVNERLVGVRAPKKFVVEPVKESLIDQRIKQMARELDASRAANPTERSQNEQFLDKKLQEIEKEFKVPENETEEERKRREYENEMSATLNELLIKNMELTQELEDLKSAPPASEKAMVELKERHSELITKRNDLEQLNWELTQELDRTETLNDELEAANAQLSREKEELVSKGASATSEVRDVPDAEIDHEDERLNEELKRKIELFTRQNEMLSKALAETSTDSGDEYEMIDELAADASEDHHDSPSL